MLRTISAAILALAIHGGGAAASSSWFDAVREVQDAQVRAAACDDPTLSGDLNDQSLTLGYAASTCNQPQQAWMVAQILTAAQMVCQCKTNIYNKIKTIADVGMWVTCAAPGHILLFAAVDAQLAIQEAAGDSLWADCSTLSGKGAFPPVDPAVDRAVQTIETLLDWRGQLINILTGSLQKGVEGLILSYLMEGVHEAAMSKAKDFLESKITQGYQPPAEDGTRHRRSENSTGGPEAQLISELTGIQVTVRMVPRTGFTMDDVEAGIKRVLGAKNFTDKMTSLNGNVTGSKFSVQKGASATASGGAVTATSKSSAVRLSVGSYDGQNALYIQLIATVHLVLAGVIYSWIGL